MVQDLGVLGAGDVDRPLDGDVEVSLVLPAYNEASRLETSLLRTLGKIREVTSSFEIIIAEDGSTDGTNRVAARLSESNAHVIHIHSVERLGRGRALSRAFKASRGKIIAYMDVDLSTELEHLRPLIDSIREGYDLAIGSRMLEGSIVERARSRRFASRVYNALIRALLKTDVSDHQCGFKAFKREALNGVIDDIRAEHWFWDTELIVLATRSGFKVKEIPVTWRGTRGSSVRLVSDTLGMGFQALRMWCRMTAIGDTRKSGDEARLQLS